MVKVKICGVTNLEDALYSVHSGCDALGFIFYKRSPRYIAPIKAKTIINNLPKNIIKTGVFVNCKEKEIRRIAKLCGLDMLQFHGDESPEFCKKFRDYKVIKAFRVRNKIELKDILKYRTFAYLFDAFLKSKIGGTGKKFNWKLIRHIKDIKRQIILSGGLTERNVKEAIEVVQPDWVDVSSSVEIMPGKKDYKKIKKFIQTVKNK